MSTTAERLIATGHKPHLDDDGEIDIFAIDFGHHNGPACSVCAEGRCQHCDDGSPFEPCPGEEEVGETSADEVKKMRGKFIACKGADVDECHVY